MKKITIITMQLRTPGGIERFISTLAAMLSDDFEVEIVANYGRAGSNPVFPLPKNIKVTYLTPNQPKIVSMKTIILGFKWHQIPAELKRRRSINSTQNKAFKNYFSNLQTDFIITDRAHYNNLINKYYHGSAIKIATDHNFHQNNPKYINELMNSIRGYNYLVVATKELQNFYSSKTAVKCVSIPNPLASIPAKKSPLNTKNIVSVGRLEPEKDYSLLISAMKIVHEKSPDIHLTIIGSGKEEKILKKQIKSQNLESAITMTGWLSQDQIEKYYYNSSLFVSTSRTEAFGLALAEAMSYGLPCLALTRASGARDQITKAIGKLLNTEDPNIIASEIIKLLNSPKQLQDYQQNINQTISKYSVPEVKQFWVNLLDR